MKALVVCKRSLCWNSKTKDNDEAKYKSGNIDIYDFKFEITSNCIQANRQPFQRSDHVKKTSKIIKLCISFFLCRKAILTAKLEFSVKVKAIFPKICEWCRVSDVKTIALQIWPHGLQTVSNLVSISQAKKMPKATICPYDLGSISNSC